MYNFPCKKEDHSKRAYYFNLRKWKEFGTVQKESPVDLLMIFTLNIFT